MAAKVTVTIEDVGGTFKRFVTEAPKLCRKLLGTAVFLTSRRVLTAMEIGAPLGPDGQGATPDDHIKYDLEENWASSHPLSARVGILKSPEQAAVALYNEYAPNKQPFMKIALLSQESSFHREAMAALKSIEAQFANGSRTTPGSRG